MDKSKIKTFSGDAIAVHFAEDLCIGIAECGRATGALFEAGRTPWCDPDQESVARVREIVERCPSGALTYTDASGGEEVAPADNTITVISDGPFYVSGALAIEGFEDRPEVKHRAALCRCGQSENKPFCDNSHREANFRDYGAVGDAGPGASGSGGPLKIKANPGGSLLVQGHFRIRAASGRLAWHGDKVSLCRCGASHNKPFCDGKHREIGFEKN